MLSYVRPRASNPYPVGSIYQTANPNFDPAVAFGGVWVRIKGRVLVGVDEADPDLAAAAAVGGEKEHTLTVEETPSHYHSGPKGYKNVMFDMSYEATWGSQITNVTGYGAVPAKMNSVGGDQPHNNMPPYYTVYIWQRTA